MIELVLLANANNELHKKVEELLPVACSLSKVEHEGPDVVIYLKNISEFYKDENLIRKIAGTLRKRVLVRSDPSSLVAPDKALEKIKAIVPEEAGVTDITFFPQFCEVAIDSLKPGLVIGKGGATLKEIIFQTGWAPKILRTPTMPSNTVSGIRKSMLKEADNRKKFLLNLGKVISTPPAAKADWVKVTALGGFHEVGRMCILVQTPNDKILIDCGVNPETNEGPKAFPYLSSMGITLDQLSAVVVTHAHLDHCLHPDSFIQLSDGSIKKISEIADGEKVPAVDFNNSLNTDNMPALQRGAIKAPPTLFDIRTKSKRLKVTAEHPFFVLTSGGIEVKKAGALRRGDFVATIKRLNIEGKPQKLPESKGLPSKTSPALCQLIGYILGDGNKMGGGYSTICCTDKNTSNLYAYARLFKKFGFKPRVTCKERNRLKVNSIPLRKWLEEIEPSMLGKSPKRRVPQAICRASKVEVAAFLRGLFDAEGSVKHHSLVLTTSSENIVHAIQLLLLHFGIISHIYDHDESKSTFGGGPAYQLAISDPASIETFLSQIGFDDESKLAKAKEMAKHIGGAMAPRMDLLPVRGDLFLSIAKSIGLRKIDVRRLGFAHTHYTKHYPSMQKAKEIVSKFSEIAARKGIKIAELELLKKLVNADVLWEPVEKIAEIHADCKEVYDLTVPGHSNYMANGIIVHNCGFVPYLYKYGFDGPVYCTPPTRDLMILLQFDYIKVLSKGDSPPPYDEKDVRRMLDHVVVRDYEDVTDITPEIKLTFHNAGHILGSSMVHLHIGEGLHNLVYTGDLKYGFTKLFDPANAAFPRSETIFMESTYGGRNDIQPIRQESEQKLMEAIMKTIGRGGKVLIPVFAVGRSQEVMLVLEEYAQTHPDFNVPVYIDGMILEASAIHTAYPEFLRQNVQRRVLSNNSPFESKIFEPVKKKRQEIVDGDPCVILAPSGMLSGGPSLEYLKLLAEGEKNSLIFVGYQSALSLGRKLQHGAKEVPLHGENGRLQSVKVNMEIQTVEGFSGHSDRAQLLAFAKNLKPRPERIFTLHGDEGKCDDLARTINKMLHIETRGPMNLDAIRLK